jgi:hypothetical protein
VNRLEDLLFNAHTPNSFHPIESLRLCRVIR